MCKNTWKPPDERPSAEVQRVRGHVGSHSALSWWHRGSRQDTQGEPVARYVQAHPPRKLPTFTMPSILITCVRYYSGHYFP